MNASRFGLWSLLIALFVVPGCQTSEAFVAKEQDLAGADCGRAGVPDCPTQLWMKATLQPYLRQQDYGRLAIAFAELSHKAPEDFDEWGKFANQGLAGAQRRDEALIRGACRDCHQHLRDRFRKQLSARHASW